jgi:hypothetical protein
MVASVSILMLMLVVMMMMIIGKTIHLIRLIHAVDYSIAFGRPWQAFVGVTRNLVSVT